MENCCRFWQSCSANIYIYPYVCTCRITWYIIWKTISVGSTQWKTHFDSIVLCAELCTNTHTSMHKIHIIFMYFSPPKNHGEFSLRIGALKVINQRLSMILLHTYSLWCKSKIKSQQFKSYDFRRVNTSTQPRTHPTHRFELTRFFYNAIKLILEKILTSPKKIQIKCA